MKLNSPIPYRKKFPFDHRKKFKWRNDSRWWAAITAIESFRLLRMPSRATYEDHEGPVIIYRRRGGERKGRWILITWSSENWGKGWRKRGKGYWGWSRGFQKNGGEGGCKGVGITWFKENWGRGRARWMLGVITWFSEKLGTLKLKEF